MGMVYGPRLKEKFKRPSYNFMSAWILISECNDTSLIRVIL